MEIGLFLAGIYISLSCYELVKTGKRSKTERLERDVKKAKKLIGKL